MTTLVRYALIAILMGASLFAVSALGLNFNWADLFAFAAGAGVGGVFWLTKPRRVEYVEVSADENA